MYVDKNVMAVGLLDFVNLNIAVLVYLKSILSIRGFEGRAERGIRMIKIQLFKKCCFVGPFLLAVGIENQRIGTRMI
jgi:hypothetical protein